MALVFDNNRSLWFDLDDDKLAYVERYIPWLVPQLGTAFVIAARD